MKSNNSVALNTLPAKAFSSRESILLLLLKLRTFIALILIVGFFAITVPDFLATGSLVIMVKHI
ncbi:ABC transporter permease, partial [Pantoea sp. M_5]